MKPGTPNKQRQRVHARRDAVRVVQHLRFQEGKSVRVIAEQLGRSESTIRRYLSDPDATKSRALKERYRGTCSSCGTPTSGGDGRGRARRVCVRCNGDLMRRWNADTVLAALLRWQRETGRLPTSYDLNPSWASKRGGDALQRMSRGEYPTAATVREVFGSFAAAKLRAQAEVDGP